MKVLLVNNCSSQSGIGRYAISLYTALQNSLGERVRLYSCRSEKIERLFYLSLGKPLIYLAEETARSIALIHSVMRIPRQYDVYHFLNPVLSAFSPFIRPRIITIHDTVAFQLKRSVSDYVIERLIRSVRDADLVICVSSFTARLFQEKVGTKSGKIVVIPLGVDNSKFRPRNKLWARRLLGLPDDTPVVLHVGSDEKRKNIDGLFRIFRHVKNKIPTALLLRLGITTVAYPPKDLSRSVRLLTPSDEQLPYYYNAADLLIFPSILEGFGLPLLEAMASGTPIVTTTSASIPEVVGDAAVAFDPRDDYSLAESAASLLTNSDLAKTLSEKGVRRAERFTWSNCARLTEEAYRKVLNGEPPRD